MTFLNASLLFGSALVALPIVLHLIMRRRPRHLEFPALRFVAQRQEANQRRLRLRHLLLLALRVGVILLLAAALARPSVKFSGPLGSQKAPVAAALVFDTSMRMDYLHENQSRLDAAKDFGLWLIGQLPAESEIAVLDARRGPASFQAHRGAARHRIEQLATVAVAEPMTAVLEKAVQLLATSKLAGRELYVLTDLARVAWPVEAAAAVQNLLASHPEIGLYVIDVGVEAPTNTSLGQLRLSAQVPSDRSPLSISTDVRRAGGPERGKVALYMLEGGPSNLGESSPRKRMEQIVELDGGQSRSVDFKIEGLGVGGHQGYVEIAGDDALQCDNRRWFSVEVNEAWQVLVVAPAPAELHGLFLTSALAPAGFRREGRARFDCKLAEYDGLAQEKLEDYAAIWLLDPPGLEPATWTRLEDYVRQGRGLAVCLGRGAKPLEAFRTPAAQAVLPAVPVRQARAPQGEVYFAPGTSQHPILGEFRKFEQTVPWPFHPVLRYWQLKDWNEQVSAVVALSDGEPALLERSVGAGRVLTMTTPISDPLDGEPWNLLPAGEAWPFVILVNGMASYLVGSLDEQLNYFAGQTVVLRLGPHDEHRSYAMTAPGNFEVRLTPDLADRTLVITATEGVGNYRVLAGGAAERFDRPFSVNLPPEQTELARADREHLARIFGDAPFQVARQRGELEGNVNRGRVGRELFPMLILLLALVLAAEHLLANRFYRE